MKRALMYTHVASMTKLFNMDNIKLLQDMGYKVDVACNFEFGNSISDEEIKKFKIQLKNMNVDYYHIPIPRNLLDFKKIYISYKKSKNLMDKKGYDLIHCHSPIGAIICRIANRHSKFYRTTKMIYTAHGFHFFKGNSPIKNFVFRNVEKFGARYTDVLITINKEDFDAARKFTLKENGRVEYVPGVGLDIRQIDAIEYNRKSLCKKLNIPLDSILMMSAGELNDNKNHKVVIDALSCLPNNVHYIVCGQGPLMDSYIEQAKKMKIIDRLHLLGYRSDVLSVMKSCDIFIFPSKREGLPVSLMEAMSCGLLCIVSNVRGNKDLIFNDKNGFVIELDSFSDDLVEIITNQINEVKIKNYRDFNKNIIQNYSKKSILLLMKKIYK